MGNWRELNNGTIFKCIDKCVEKSQEKYKILGLITWNERTRDQLR